MSAHDHSRWAPTARAVSLAFGPERWYTTRLAVDRGSESRRAAGHPRASAPPTMILVAPDND